MPEPETMDAADQTRAGAEADFVETHDRVAAATPNRGDGVRG